ncbi:MAG TPA: DUF2911 domain-containing protein [Blastocatellia bacterium]|nr:DUF2911 domain-containing protein [Blastocatellia bacterium]
MKLSLRTIALLLVVGSAAFAQDGKPTVVAFGGDQDDRSSVRIGLFDTVKKSVIGEFAIDYGRPVWKKDYENATMFDLATKGKVWRLGSNFWTVLDTNVPLSIAGKSVPVGVWYLGIHRSDDGATWSLAFIDPAKARNSRIDPFDVGKAPVDFKVPITFEKATEIKDKLTITLAPQKDNFKNSTLKILWGTLQLSAQVQIQIAG